MEDRPNQPQSAASEACLLVYDGNCRLCVGTKEKLEEAGLGRPGSAIRFIPYQSDEAKQVLGSRYLPGRPDAAFLVRPTGEVREGLEAFLPLIPSLPGGRALLWVLRFVLARRMADWAYRVIARYRYRVFGHSRSTDASC
jgi:predicted DCC family thiol-disulfide oxidoreductase YuxK